MNPVGRPDQIGVLGGMGPLATADFLSKLVRATPVARDQDHLPVVVASLPQIPCRQAAARGEGESPAAALIAVRRLLEGAGARCLAMPCNAAHLWYDQLVEGCSVPFLHIVDAAAQALGDRDRVGIVASPATLRSRLYADRLDALGVRCVEPTEAAAQDVVDAIARIKIGDVAGAAPGLGRAIEAQLEAGAQAVILACTELPLALPYLTADLAAHSIDATDALARACVRWGLAQR